MTSTSNHPIETIVSALLEAPSQRPTLTATVDLTPDGSGQPPALKVIGTAVREAVERLDSATLGHGDVDRLREEGQALEEAATDASARGALGLVYVAEMDGALRVVELDSPLRTSVHVGAPRVFELVRAVYLDRPVVLVTTDLHTMDVVRVQHGAEGARDGVDWPAHYLTKKGQRTHRDAPAAGSAAGTEAAGHSYVSDERRVEEQRRLFANEAAQRLSTFAQPGDLLVVEGVEEARSQLLGQLPAEMASAAIQRPWLNPAQQEDPRERNARLRVLAEEAQVDLGTAQAALWFSGEYGEQAIGGPEAVRSFAEQGRIATVLVHQEAGDHWGHASDARYRAPSVDAAAVEAALEAAIRQGAVVRFAADARLLEQQGGIVGVARY
jgi:hypothetical protein